MRQFAVTDVISVKVGDNTAVNAKHLETAVIARYHTNEKVTVGMTPSTVTPHEKTVIFCRAFILLL